MSKQYRVNVYDDEELLNVISRVRYNQNLDYWNGKNWQNGGTGKHRGLTKLKDGRYVLIYGTDWQGEKDFAIIIDSETAMQEILKSGNYELLRTKKFKELKKLYNELASEDEEDE